MNDSKLIIITDYYSLQQVDDRVEQLQGFDNLENKGYLKFDSGRLIDVETLDDTEIVFVWDRFSDEVSDSARKTWWENIFLTLKKADDKWHIIHHSKGLMPNKSESILCRKGAHIPNDPRYGVATKVLLDTEDNKKERIIKSVFTIEPILAFLHGCLEKKPEQVDFEKLEDVGIDISSLPQLNGELCDERYFSSLSALRDELLK
ncbi:hypothetical protein [Parabacteroides sp. PF5-9]|uniref:hypothetical protein n=1 Tax=Parabacteroides sp. PF5-9 TaxID=1742404 RepID=UPI0024744476|nr:hypothetical protein [Parabacteroides sp. PF5-9]MDH6357789.1 hypothetical protein [Parabacteroides sp. PF5-9]